MSAKRKMVSAKEYAALNGANYAYVRILCNKKPCPIKGSKKIGGQWFIPSDAKYPSQKRVKKS